jgi:hypothetical protein
MIRRETVLAEKRVVNKMDYHPTRQTVNMLCDGLLEALDAIDGGQGQRDWEQERREVEKQTQLALADLRATLHIPMDTLSVNKAAYTLACIDEMLSAKLRNRRKWDWYQPRIEEEFG